MKNFTKLIFVVLFAFTQAFTTQAQDLTLTGVMDFTVPGGGSAGKAIHVTALDNISDLSDYGVSVASNGNGPDAAEEYTFPAITVNSGDDILLARDTTVMLAYLSGCSGEFEHVLYASTSVTQNGDDAIQLWHNGVWIETFGDPDVDGTGEAWEYVDSWAYRTSTTVVNLSTKISDCGDFDAGPTAWPYVLVAATVADGASSQLAQTFTMNVTSLPTGGANVRVAKTTANGNWFFGPPVALTLGSNSLTVGSVTFDRSVKFQFSSGDTEFDDLILNGTSSDCPLPPPPSSLISDCGDFDAGPTAWPYVLTATTVADGASSQGPQTFSMNVTSLPTGGANFRVYKTTANGSDFFGPAIAMTLGSNGITVGGVSFDRTVKFQFSSGDVVFDELVLNGVTSGCAGPPAFVETDWSYGGTNCTDGTTTIYDASCMYPICNNDFVLNMTDSWGDGWNGNTWTATGTTSGTVYGPFTISSLQGASNTETFSSSDYCFTITCGGGSYQSEVGWSLEDGSGNVLLSGGAPYSGNYGNCTLGCTDPNASDYDASADIDDGSCTYAPCGALAPTHETFSTGVLPVGTCTPNQWAISALAGDGWRFTGNPGYNASTTMGNNRVSGEFAWIDFSGTDTDPVLEVEDIDASGLTTPGLVIDYFSDLGTYTCGDNNILHIEAYDGTSWVSVSSLQLNATGWNTYAFSLAGMENTTTSMMQIRFRGESSGLSCDYYNDLLLDDVRVRDVVLGCTDPSYDNYDASAEADDGSCAYNYTLYMYDSFGDGWNGNTWSATGLNTGTVYGPYGGTFTGASDTATFSSGDLCFDITCGGGSWQSEVSWDLHVSGSSILTGGAPYSGNYNNGCASGCNDPAANNYDPLAVVDDGSCVYGCVDTDTTESFEAGLGAWEQDPNDNFDWIAQSGGTLSGSTGPSGAFDGLNYLYTESSVNYGNTANLTLACFDPTTFTSATFIFAYHMYGAAMGTLNVDVSTDDGVTWTNIWTLSGDQGNQWNEAIVDLSSYTSQIDLRIQGITGTSFTSDMAIDYLRLQEAPVSGCTDPNATNYDPLANLDDGSCTYLSGCTNTLADNYDPLAYIDDGSCTYTGCTNLTLYMQDSFGDGWNGNILNITGSNGYDYGDFTITTGSADTALLCLPDDCFTVTCGGGSWQGEVSWSLVDDAGGAVVSTGGAPYSGSFCLPIIYGCTDPSACFYDPLANYDDGSCTYGDWFTVNMYDSWGDGWNGNHLDLIDTSGTVVFTTTLSSLDGAFATDSFCLDVLSSCYDVYCGDGAWQTEVSWEIVDGTGTIVLTGGAPYSGTFGNCVYGCTDPTAVNYDATATVDDGSCTSCDIMTLTMNDSWGDGWNGNRWQLVDLSGNIYYDTTLTSGSTQTLTLCVLAGECYEVVVGGGSYQSEVSWTLADDAGTTVLSGGAPYSGNYVGTGCAYGCTEPLADNYDASANLDDGSCSYAACLAADTSESFESGGIGAWIQSSDDNFDWTVGGPFGTPSFGTGPSAAYDSSNYLFIESSFPNYPALSASIYTPCVDLSAWNNPSFVFAYHMYGADMGTLLIEVSNDGGLSWDSAWALTGDQGDQWYQASVDLTSYSGSVAVKITGTTGNNFTSDFALDLLRFQELPVFACMDPNAANYDATATDDDGSCLYATTFNVDMGCVAPGSFTSVSVESPNLSCYGGCITLSDPDGDDVWSVTLDLTPGAYVYLYAIDNNSSQENLVDDMLNGASCAPYTDFFSYANREIVVGTSSITADDTYGSCDPCIRGCTDPAANNYDSLAIVDNGTCEYDVTFVVDMNCSGLTPTTLAATGPADNWSGNTYLLSDADGDGIWEGTHSVTDNFVYMYVVDSWADSEFSGLFNEMLNGTNSCAPVTDGLSYAYRLAASPSTTSDTYGQCSVCPPGCTDPAASNYDANAQIDDGSCVYATTFNVDMNCEPAGSFGFVHLESPVFGWCGGCIPMADPDGDGVHSVTIDLPLGNFEYKYAVDYWAGQEDLVDDMQSGGTCAPVTDYWSYANRLVDVVAGTNTSDTYGSCDICDQVNGCTDPGAINYDAFATDDDGSCLFSTTFNVDMNCEPAGSFGYVHLESPSFGWCGGCVPMADPDGDGVHSVTVDLPAGNFEYKYAVDGWAGQENLIDDMQNGASCAPVTDYWSYANRLLDVNELSVGQDDKVTNGDFSNGQYGWSMSGGFAIINEKADLWKQNSTTAVLMQNNVVTAGLSYQVTFDAEVYTGSFDLLEGNANNLILSVDSSGTYSATFVATNNYIFFNSTSNYCDLTIDNITIFEVTYNSAPEQDDTYSSCDECITGCMDSLAFNYSDSAMVDDGSCLYGYNCPAPYPIGLSSSDIYAEMATIHWNDANSGSCRVWKYFVRYRPVGDSVWTTRAAGVGSGLCNVGLPNTSKVLRNLMPSTTYEFKMKAFYCGGGESGYSYTDNFTTLAPCPPMTNLAVQTFTSNHGKAKFTWDETGPYTFARIALRVNTPGSSWQTAGGFGVNYPQLYVMKFGLTGGTDYRAQGRTFCDPVVTSYRSTWTAPIVWTQPGVAPIRLEGGNSINNLEVYPNPSKDIFNVSFVSEDMQNLEVRVLNLIGEVVYTEGLEQFIGEYTKSINMSSYTKGVYFLEITTNNGVVNKKIVLQ